MLTEAQVIGAFNRRYERHMNAPWFPGPHGQAMVDLTRLLNACPAPRPAECA